MITSFYSQDELLSIGFQCYGRNVFISRKASIYSPEKIKIGNDVRVDDFCILSGRIEMGNNIHIAAYTALYGGDKGIFIDDFANLSSRICVYSISDDYSGLSMTNPTIPDKYKQLNSSPVYIGKHVIIGSTSVILPGVKISDGGAFGCFSLINKSTEPWNIYAGIPCKLLKRRSRNVEELAEQYLLDHEENA